MIVYIVFGFFGAFFYKNFKNHLTPSGWVSAQQFLCESDIISLEIFSIKLWKTKKHPKYLSNFDLGLIFQTRIPTILPSPFFNNTFSAIFFFFSWLFIMHRSNQRPPEDEDLTLSNQVCVTDTYEILPNRPKIICSKEQCIRKIG